MHVQEPALTGAFFPDWCCMLFVLVIRKPLFVLWFMNDQNTRTLIVNCERELPEKVTLKLPFCKVNGSTVYVPSCLPDALSDCLVLFSFKQGIQNRAGLSLFLML